MRRSSRPYLKRHEMEAYAEEIVAMVLFFKATYEDHPTAWDDFCRREFRAAWEILRKKHGARLYHDHALWRNALAVRMGWLRGRIGGPDAEWVHQRRLEKLGQRRLFDL